MPEFNTELFVTPKQELENVQIVLRENISGASTSILASNRISSFEAVISVSGGTDGGIRDLMLNTSNGLAGPLNGSTYLHYFGDFGNGLESTRVSDDVYETLLGWVTIYGPTSGSMVLQVNDPRPNVDGDFGIVGNADFGLESLGTFTGEALTVTAVPEPCSLLLTSLIVSGGLGVRCFTRKKVKGA